MWNNVKTEEQIQEFMEKILYFHDSCIKEIKYISGAYVTDSFSMFPINDKRILSVLIQRQFKDIPMLEMQFAGLKYLQLYPDNMEYTCEIFGASLFLKENYIIWCDDDWITPDNLDDYEGTVICAESMKWRIVDSEMGSEPFYLSKA